jgi:hypothetical protein
MNDIRGGLMKACLRGLLVSGLLCASVALAQEELAGDWRGRLAVDANTSLPVQLMFTKKPDGSYSAVLNSLDNEFIKNVAASAVSWKDGALKVEVPALSGSYAGALKDDHFEGQWSQAGSKAIPLALSRPPQASKADLETLTGSWRGTLPGPMKATVVFEFKQDVKGPIAGTLSVPEQGALGIQLANLEIGPGTIAFKIPPIAGEYKATFSGTSMTGSFKQGGQPPNGLPLNLTKGDITTEQRLGLGGDAFTVLYGNWKGKVGKLEAVLRFTLNGMQQVAFVDVPEQKAMSIPVTSASAAGKKVVFKVASLGGEFSGELAGKTTLTGQWIQGGKTTPVTWTKQ